MTSACVSLEPYALRVLDDSMAPELPAGSVVVVDPGEPPEEGSLVVVEQDGEVVLRRIRFDRGGTGGARLLAPGEPDRRMAGDWRRAVRGVVVGTRAPRRASFAPAPRGGGEGRSPRRPGGR